jgi:hypothetical protein
VHLDLRAAAGVPEGRADALEAECTRLVALRVNAVRIVMPDPEGSIFCFD